MPFYKTEEFLTEIVSHVKFIFDRDKIKMELKHHMMDKIDYYMESGYGREEAENITIKDMGDPEEIGTKLNKEHNPLIGWIWKITNIGIVLFCILNIFTIGAISLLSIFSTSGINKIPKEDIVYRINLDEKIQIDNRVITITNLVYEQNGNMNIFYKDYERKFLGAGWSFGDIGEIKDDLGNEYMGSEGFTSSGVISKSRRVINDFSKDAKILIIERDRYNRKYRLEIPLKIGEGND